MTADYALELDDAVLDLGTHRALDGVTLRVAPGEKVVLFGPSGGGKSSLLRCILGLERLTSGSVRVGGRDVSGGGASELRAARRRIGTIFQNFNLFTQKTVVDNVALSATELVGLPKAEAHVLATKLLDRVGVRRLAHRYPFELSGGEQQRVAIARALMAKPEILLLDEPTSALDPELVQGVLALIEEIVASGKLTVLCVTHELGFARRLADRVAFLASGRIVEEGPPGQLLDHPSSDRLAAFLRARDYGRAGAGGDAKLG